ncbi:hypothetical protein [Aminipila luticellarii]|uniref:hypothetical protein n=1 Tax=Aminipila luticellarii TaxID=2507160 RepID=UPI001E575621|nr:hypothetical protein [Aminipila luticellarii]
MVQINEKEKCAWNSKYFSMLKNRISDGADVPYFFRDLIAMITDVAEDEWATPKDPSTKLSKESTIRSYAKRNLSQKFAQSIVYRLTPEVFVSTLEERPDTVLRLLAEDYKCYDASADKSNIAKKLADCFVEIIRTAVGLVEQGVLEQQKRQQLALEWKNNYGAYLLSEAEYTCAFPGCG